MEESRVLSLSSVDDIPIGLTFRYFYESGQLDVDRLEQAVEDTISSSFWPLRGIVGKYKITVTPPYPKVFHKVIRLDLSVEDVEKDVILLHHLAGACLIAGKPVLSIRVTTLSNGYLLGINISHSFGDAYTYYALFLPILSAHYNGEPITQKVTHDRSVLFPTWPVTTTTFPREYYLAVERSDQHDFPFPVHPTKSACPSPGNRKLYSLTAEDIELLKEVGQSKRRVAAVFGMVWKALGGLCFALPCNVRERPDRFEPVIPASHAGNALFMQSSVHPDAENADLASLAQLCAQAIANCTSSSNRAVLALLHEEGLKKDTYVCCPVSGDVMTVTAWLHWSLSPTFDGHSGRCVWHCEGYPDRMAILTDGINGGIDIHVNDHEWARIDRLLQQIKLAHQS